LPSDYISHDGAAVLACGYNARMVTETFSARLANVALPEAGGGEVRLGSLWEQGPGVLVFLRHYG